MSDDGALNIERVQFLASLVGVRLGHERAGVLLAQAEPHFALMELVMSASAGDVEPAAEFRLDHWQRPDVE
jgi:hypothetical protein